MDNPTTNTQQKTLDDLEYYQALEEKRRQINKERCDAMEPMYTERFNVDEYMAWQVTLAENSVDDDPEDEFAVEWLNKLREEIPNMPLKKKLDFVEEGMYREDPSGCEETLRTLNLVTPYETMTRLVDIMPLSQKTIEAAVAVHKSRLKLGIETEKLGFRRKGGQYHLNEAQEKYVRAGLVDRYTREGEDGSAELMRMVYDSDWYPCLEPDQYEEEGGFSWETINMEDYRAGRLLPFGDGFPRGAFGPKHDRIEYLADLLKRGEIDVPTFWKRVQDSSYVADQERFGPEGEESFIITKKNWRQFLECWDEGRPDDYEPDPSVDVSVFPRALGGDSWDEFQNRSYDWHTKDWEAWIDSLPDDWWTLNTDAVDVASYQVEEPRLVPEMVKHTL
ncbi:hypothetical protein HMPREF2765_04005 [Rothia sp. HMSC062H08]|uniref:hypothetical protein n=1 Tax=Rothia sp. HMSC062H08 TaxID=1739269 RepID=UPI0008A20049|nr:hypothetical protein [Rothia sp. HMSC062H08]OFL50289.1 hypothetical protein HMPREF2765_04005 [Rothia sp. HMSC062H08]